MKNVAPRPVVLAGARMLFAGCDPFCAWRRTSEVSRRRLLCLLYVQLQQHRFGPRISMRSSERPVTSMRKWRNCTFLAQSSSGAQITRQVVCRVSVGQKIPRGVLIRWLCRVSVGQKSELESPSNGSSRRASHISGRAKTCWFLRFSGPALRMKISVKTLRRHVRRLLRQRQVLGLRFVVQAVASAFSP